MKKLANLAAYWFIFSIAVLSIVSIFGIWDVLAKDVIMKSFQSLLLLGVVAVVIIIAQRFIGNGEPEPVSAAPMTPVSTTFTFLRHMTLSVLIVSVGLLALVGLLSIWEILQGDVITKSLTSIAIVAFSSFIIVLTCLERENHKLVQGKDNHTSPGVIVLIVILLWFGITLFSGFLGW